MATEIGVTSRHMRILWAKFCLTGSAHVPKTLGWPTSGPSPDEVQMVLDAHKREDVRCCACAMNL